MEKEKQKTKESLGFCYLGEIDVEEEGFLGVGDLNAILRLPLDDVHVVHSLRNLLHRWCKLKTLIGNFMATIYESCINLCSCKILSV